MKAFIFPTGCTVSPFNLPPAEIPVVDTSFRAFVEKCLTDLRIEPVYVTDHAADAADEIQKRRESGRETLLLEDDLFFTPRLIKRFLKEARTGGKPVSFASVDSLFVSRNTALQGIEPIETAGGVRCFPYNLVYIPEGNTGEKVAFNEKSTSKNGKNSTFPEVAAVRPLPFTHKERRIPLEGVERFMGVKAETAFSLEGIVRLTHWSHILTVNMLAFASMWTTVSPGTVLRGLGRILTAVPPTRSRIKRRLVFTGKGCKIHPLANVELSILGDNVTIGPFVNIFASCIGDGVSLEQHVSVTGSFIGAESMLSNFGTINASVLFPRVYISQPGCQWSVLGERVKMTPLAQFADMMIDPTFTREVRVMHEGRMQPSGRKFLGAAVGQNSIIGTGIWGAAGLEIPAETVIIRQPHRILQKMPDPPVKPGVPYYVSGGTLKQVHPQK